MIERLSLGKQKNRFPQYWQARPKDKPGREGDRGKRLFLLVLRIPGTWGLGVPHREGLGSPEREKGGQAPGSS